MASSGWVEDRGNGKWRLNVNDGTDDDGRRIVRRKTVKAKDREDALRQLGRFTDRVEKGDYVEAARKLTFGKLVGDWLKNYAVPALGKRTVWRYRHLLDSRILPALGHKPVNKITSSVLLAFYNSLKDDGARADGKEGGLSETTVLHHHRLIHSIFAYGVEMKKLSHNPAHFKKAPKAKKIKVQCYNEDQAAELFAALDNAETKYRALVNLAIDTGARRGELVGLEWRHVDFEKNTITIEQSASYIPHEGQATKDTKTEESNRVITVPRSTMALLEQWQKEQRKHRFALGEKWTSTQEQWIFTTWNGRQVNVDVVSNWFGRFIRDRGLDHCSFHSLRHLHATILANSKTPAKVISSRLGHSNFGTTMNIYAEVFKSADSAAADAMEAYRNRGKKQA